MVSESQDMPTNLVLGDDQQAKLHLPKAAIPYRIAAFLRPGLTDQRRRGGFRRIDPGARPSGVSGSRLRAARYRGEGKGNLTIAGDTRQSGIGFSKLDGDLAKDVLLRELRADASCWTRPQVTASLRGGHARLLVACCNSMLDTALA
jgi:hypothetical protein